MSFEGALGDVVSLVGVNGSGKSTTLRLAAGVECPDAGQVLYGGRVVDEVDVKFRRSAAVVLDDFGILPDLIVSEHLDLLARAHAMADVGARVNSALASLGIEHVADQLPATLSSGQQHRLALASVLVRDAQLLILDEPEQRLDADGRAWLATHLRLLAEAGVAVLMASHDVELLRETAARTIMLDAA